MAAPNRQHHLLPVYDCDVRSRDKIIDKRAKKADRTVYDVRYSCRIEPPKMPRLE